MCVRANNGHFFFFEQTLRYCTYPRIFVFKYVEKVNLEFYSRIDHFIIQIFFSLEITISFSMRKNRSVGSFACKINHSGRDIFSGFVYTSPFCELN